MTSRPSAFRILRLLRTIVVAALAAAFAAAAETPTQFARLDLLDGRKLKNVTVRSYDTASGRVLLVADRKAMSIPIALIPPPFAQQFKSGLLAGGGSMTIVVAPPSTPPEKKASATPTAGGPSPAPAPTTPTSPTGTASSENPSLAHTQVAADRAARYFRYELRMGSNSVSVYEVDIEILGTENVSGWQGRYRTKGKAYIQYYDSVGGSYSRQTEGFEIITERKSDGAVVVIDLSRLAHTSL